MLRRQVLGQERVTSRVTLEGGWSVGVSMFTFIVHREWKAIDCVAKYE